MNRFGVDALKLCFFLVALLVISAGCGKSGPPVYHVAGTVTFKGEPVPAGTVLFQPDESQGCTGPAGIAHIKDGKYDTAEEGGKGVVGGPHLVRITGLDGKPVEMAPEGVPLFPDFTTTVDLPTEDSSHDFVVTND